MSNIAVLDDYRKTWVSGPVACVHCAHEWVAVREQGTRMLECPHCGESGGKSLDDLLDDLEVLVNKKMRAVLEQLIALEFRNAKR